MRLKKNNAVSFDELTHSYICGDKLLTGVTTLLHRHNLAPDLSFIPKDKLQEAADRGTAIHNLIEYYEDKKPVVDDAHGNLQAYKTLDLKVHCTEYLVSDNDTVASMIDLVCEDCSLVDIKSWAKSSVSRENIKYVTWQLSIYAYLFEKQNPSKKVPAIFMARVRDGEAELRELERIPDEKVAELIKAEKEGYTYAEDIPDAALALPDDDAMALAESLTEIARYKAMLKAEEERAAAIQERLYEYMVSNNLDEMGCELGKFIRKSEYTRTSIDSVKLKKEEPEIFEKYQKTTLVKGSVTFKAI